MQTEQKTDEINLSYISNSIEKRFKKFLKTCVTIFLFYKKKWLLFLGLLIIGIIAGYVLDSKLGYTKEFSQEIIVEPKFDTREYIYDYVNNLKYKLKDSLFLTKIKLDSNSVKNLKTIEVKPLIRAKDVLDNLHKKYGDKEYFHQIIEKYDPKTLENERYHSFYKYHRLIFTYNKQDSQNNEISQKILNHIPTNTYYQKVLNQNTKQVEKSLKKNRETLQYIEQYLENMSNSKDVNSNDLVMIGKESEIPTISSLLSRKQTLLSTIRSQENALIFNRELFEVVETGDIILYHVSLWKKMIFIIPAFLIFLVSMIFLLRQLPDRLMEYLNS